MSLDFTKSIVKPFQNEEKILEAFKTGKGLGWGNHHHYLFEELKGFSNLIT